MCSKTHQTWRVLVLLWCGLNFSRNSLRKASRSRNPLAAAQFKETPLHLAASNEKSLEIVKALCQAGAKTEERNQVRRARFGCECTLCMCDMVLLPLVGLRFGLT